MILIERRGQKRRIEVPLHRTDPTGTVMPALRERFFHELPAPVAKLAQFGLARRNFNQDAARACNGALELCYKQPWCSKTYAFAVLFLPRLIGDFFENDGVADRGDLMDFAAMQALTMGGQFALFGGFSAPGFLIRAAAFPRELLLATLLDATLFIVVVGVGRPALPIHPALEPPDVLRIGSPFLAEHREARVSLAGDQSDA